MANPGSKNPNILIADDQPDVLEALRMLLKVEGFITATAKSPADGLSLCQMLGLQCCGNRKENRLFEKQRQELKIYLADQIHG